VGRYLRTVWRTGTAWTGSLQVDRAEPERLGRRISRWSVLRGKQKQMWKLPVRAGVQSRRNEDLEWANERGRNAVRESANGVVSMLWDTTTITRIDSLSLTSVDRLLNLLLLSKRKEIRLDWCRVRTPPFRRLRPRRESRADASVR